MEGKCVLDVADPHPVSLDEHANDIEAIGVRRAAMAVDPDPGRATQLLLLPPVDRLDRLPEPIAAPRLHLHKSDRSLALDDEIDVPMAGPEASLEDTPARAPKPPLRDSLTQLSERLLGR